MAAIPSDVCASRTSRSPKVTRRIAPAGRSATGMVGTIGASTVPTARSSGG